MGTPRALFSGILEVKFQNVLNMLVIPLYWHTCKLKIMSIEHKTDAAKLNHMA